MHRVPSCPVCGNHNLVKLLAATDYTTTQESFEIERCPECTLMLTNPQPALEDLGKYYQSSSYTSHAAKPGNLFEKVYALARTYALRWKINLVKQCAPQTQSLLDLGCGVGDFLNICKQNNLSVIGVEPSAIARKIAEQKTGMLVNEKFLTEGEKVDVITAWHVLEHIPDLKQTLQTIHLRLKENGTVFIAVPNHESYDAKRFGVHWAAYDVPRHLWHFSKQSIKKLFSDNGFDLITIEPMKLDAFYVSLLSEKYQHQKLSPFSILSALTTGLISNFKARHSTNHSSLVYVFRKR